MIELMVIMAMIALLAALITPALSDLLSSSRIADTGARLAALIEQGRMHATVRHRVVGMRFFENPADPSEFTAADLVEMVPDPAAPQTLYTNALVRVFRFPDPVILSHTSSSLLAAGSSAGTGNVTLPGNTVRTYQSFFIFPDGSTSLAATATNPYIGVLDRRDASSGEIRNPLILSLDPRTCRVSVYRK